MAAATPADDGSSAKTCRGCGQSLPADTTLCAACAAKLALGILAKSDRQHTGDILVAILLFGLTNLILLGLAGTEQLSLGAMLFRLYFLGLPCAALLIKWYRLMRDIDPDYGELWQVYWNAQIVTLAAAPVLFPVLGILLAAALAIGNLLWW